MPIAQPNQGEVLPSPHGHPPPPRSLGLSLSKPTSIRAPFTRYPLWKLNMPSGRKENKPIPSPLGEGQADMPIAQANQGEVLPRRTDRLPQPEATFRAKAKNFRNLNRIGSFFRLHYER
jgi:hypothetical protein